MSSLENVKSPSEQNNNFGQRKGRSSTPKHEQHKEMDKKSKWYDDPLLQATDPMRAAATTQSSLCTAVWMGLVGIVILPITLVVLILFLLLWILPGFGSSYERYAEARDRKKYYPPEDEMKPWGPENKLIHVVHLRAPESKLPPIIYVSGLGASMNVVKPLLLKFAQYIDEPIEIFSFDSPGYGASAPPVDWTTESADTEISLLRRVVCEKLVLRKPFVLFGASAGASLAQLYRLQYPEDVAGIILFDPTPSNVFEDGSPMSVDFNGAFSLYRKMARAASWGLMRPLAPLIRYCIPGEFGDIFRLLPHGHVALFMTQTMLRKTGNHFLYWRTIMDRVSKLEIDLSSASNAVTIRRSTPLLVVSAQNWIKKRPHGSLTREEMRHWWNDNQQPFVRSSDNAGFVARTDHTHAQCMLDMKLAANATKAILAQINSKFVR